MAASLKLKKNVLILEEPRTQVPILNINQRWNVGEDYLWLAPRSIRVLLEAVDKYSSSYPDFKNSLSTYK